MSIVRRILASVENELTRALEVVPAPWNLGWSSCGDDPVAAYWVASVTEGVRVLIIVKKTTRFMFNTTVSSLPAGVDAREYSMRVVSSDGSWSDRGLTWNDLCEELVLAFEEIKLYPYTARGAR